MEGYISIPLSKALLRRRPVEFNRRVVLCGEARAKIRGGSVVAPMGELKGVMRPPYWLVVNHHGGRMAVLTVTLASGERVLPIFSLEDEAEAFVRFRGLEGGWRARSTGVGELVSVLYGPCASVQRIALDPPPEIEVRMALGLTSTSRESFVDHLIGRGRSWFQESWSRYK